MIHFAAKNNDINLCRILIGKGLNVNAPDEHRITPLILSTELNYTEMSKFLVVNGADVNAMGTSAMSPLHFAAMNGNLELVKFLVEHGADVKKKGEKGFPFRAAKGKEVRQYLLDKMKEAK